MTRNSETAPFGSESSVWRPRRGERAFCRQKIGHNWKTGTIRPISLPDDFEETENVRLWCAALRLCGHDIRPVYAREAIKADCMPEALMQYTARNDHGHMMPIPCYVSTCSARRVGVLAQICLGRTWPFWTGREQLFSSRMIKSWMRKQKMALALCTFSESSWLAQPSVSLFFRTGART